MAASYRYPHLTPDDAIMMPTPTTSILQRTHSSPSSGSTRVLLPDGLHLTLAVATPPGATHAGASSFTTQADAALESINRSFQSSSVPTTPVHLAVFLASPELIPTAHAHLRASFDPRRLPAISFIPQPPLPHADGRLIAIEAWGLGAGSSTPLAITHPGEYLVAVDFPNGSSAVLASHVEPRPYTAGVFNQTVSTLSNLRVQLQRCGVGFEQILRTWYYLGGIVDDEPDNGPQRYKELNRARAAFYDGVAFLADCAPPDPNPEHRHASIYPASTGIGTDGRTVRVAALALKNPAPNLAVVPLENPVQTAAFQYAHHYSPKSPQFARAMAVATPGHAAAILVSGTASITDSESRHLGDPAAQTHQTLDNIATLIAEPNLAHHRLPGLGATLHDLVQIRVYIKSPEHYPDVASVCRQRFGPHVPVLYVQADICRPELLVEIEAVAFTRHSPQTS